MLHALGDRSIVLLLGAWKAGFLVRRLPFLRYL